MWVLCGFKNSLDVYCCSFYECLHVCHRYFVWVACVIKALNKLLGVICFHLAETHLAITEYPHLVIVTGPLSSMGKKIIDYYHVWSTYFCYHAHWINLRCSIMTGEFLNKDCNSFLVKKPLICWLFAEASSKKLFFGFLFLTGGSNQICSHQL